MFLNIFSLGRGLRSKKNTSSLPVIKNSFISIVVSIFKDKVRFFVFLIILDLLFAFYTFSQYVLPALNPTSGSIESSVPPKKVKIKKDVYNQVMQFIENRDL